MTVAMYLIAICLVAVCASSSFFSLAAYTVSRKRILAYLGAFSIAYTIEQAFILYNEYSTQNLPATEEWGAMEDPLFHILLGAALCQPLWLAILDFADEGRKQWKHGPIAGFFGVSLFFFVMPNIDDSMRKWILYSLRQFFLLGASLYFWLQYLGIDSAVERTRYRRKVPIMAVFTALAILIFLEDTVVMLLVPEPASHGNFLTEFLYRRNIAEIALFVCIIGYAVRSSVRALELKRDQPPSPADLTNPHQRQMQEALPYFAKRHELSSREEEILGYMLDGMSNQQIAQLLQVTVGTVKTHTSHIFKKVGAANRADLVQKFWSES
ncbi:response regulator transcription factor [Rubneribacter sp.]|nr:LuxR C-terminal-related transcriptional regulator [Candidatus Rubneribacter avistercoris]